MSFLSGYFLSNFLLLSSVETVPIGEFCFSIAYALGYDISLAHVKKLLFGSMLLWLWSTSL
jgi:hypothetical protein